MQRERHIYTEPHTHTQKPHTNRRTKEINRNQCNTTAIPTQHHTTEPRKGNERPSERDQYFARWKQSDATSILKASECVKNFRSKKATHKIIEMVLIKTKQKKEKRKERKKG